MLLVCLCVCARSALKWRVIVGVHDGKPVLAEGGTVRPSQVSHQLVDGEKSFPVSYPDAPLINMCDLLKPSYLHAVPHVLLAGLLLKYLRGEF